MNQIIESFIQTLDANKTLGQNDLIENLNLLLKEQGLRGVGVMPISVVNRQSRIKSPDVKSAIRTQNLYDANGDAHTTYDLAALEPLVRTYTSIFQTIDIAVVENDANQEIVFASKRPNDYWKRMRNGETVRTMVKVDYVEPLACASTNIDKEVQESANGQWSLESKLRDDMRSKKENPLLRQKQYVALYVMPEDDNNCNVSIKAMLEHYFQDNIVVKEGKTSYCIGYAATLDEVSLRTFYKKRF